MHEGGSPRPDAGIWALGVPILGINLGGGLPAVSATLAQPPVARRLPLANLSCRGVLAILGLAFIGHIAPFVQMLPFGPVGRAKLKTAAPLVPTLVTLAADPAGKVVTVPTAMVAASPWAPGVPSSMARLAGAVPSTDKARLASDPSTSTVSEPRTSEETVIEDIV